jgi:RimJ/RimL family protein N-acetyltransferase
MNKPPPTLSDNVIRLRPFALDDAEAHLAGEDDAQVRWLSGGKSTLDGVQRWITRNLQHWANGGPVFSFAIVPAGSPSPVGMIEANLSYADIDGLEAGDANLAYGLYPAARGKGLATRAVALILPFLRAQGVSRAVIRVAPDNAPSLKVPIRVGFEARASIITHDEQTLVVFTKMLDAG